jgi:Calcineurin-like phosphoesterase
MLRGCALIIFILACKLCIAQSDSIDARIILIGDAGQLNFGREPVIDAARDLVPLDSNTFIVYLGDNLYTHGLPDDNSPGYGKAKAILDSQINIVKGTKAHVLFIPGNHDWDDANLNGLELVKRQGNYINQQGGNIKFLPVDGCPGPVEYPINDNVVIVLFDSQWFIRAPGTIPGIESDCPYKTPDQFYNELNDLLNKNSKKLVILACHHTMRSYGIHGGYYNLKQYFFPLTDMNPKLWIPLPGIGVIYPIVRGVFGTPEDLRYPAYANMITQVERIVQHHPNVLFAAGHEHTLQLIKDSSFYYIVSGAGSKSTRVNNNKKTLFHKQSFGFATLEISKNKNVHIDFYSVFKDSLQHSYSNNLLNFSALYNDSVASAIPQTKPLIGFADSVTRPIDTAYQDISMIHKLFAGKNYRKEWGMPVHLKVFRIDTEMGGFTIKSLGGGKQTKSLRLEDIEKQKWVLRTVDKEPEGTVPELLKTAIHPKIMQDMVSAEHPYGALVVPGLADAAQVVHSEPRYYFVPDDPKLGIYRKVFANKICLLELYEPTSDASDTKSTAKVIDTLFHDSKNHVDQEAILRARLLDMMIGDWDRHFDQWRFLTTDTGVGKLYVPIPRDRDNAFFYSNGFFVRSLSLAALPYLQGFRKRFTSVKWFNWEERNFDRLFMNNLDDSTWKRIIAKFQADETDTVIADAVRQLPPEIYHLDEKKMAEKLKSRRDILSKAGPRYYHFLSREVNVYGSNQNEYFRVFNTGDDLHVMVYNQKQHTDSSSLMFDRVFKSGVTKYINLYGLNGDDIFDVDSSASSKIKLRIIGGKGKDTFDIRGNVRNVVYDYKPDTNFMANDRRTKNEISSDINVNRFDIAGFNYNTYRLPLLNIAFNNEDKVLAGIGYSLKTYSFRKDPYSTYQRITSLFNLHENIYQVKYLGEFNQLLNRYDLVPSAAVYNSVLNNFFGLGNNTKKGADRPFNFYQVRYNYFAADIMLRKRFHSLAELSFGPSYYQYWNHSRDNTGKVLSQPSVVGLDSAGIYAEKAYAGAKVAIVIHNVNSDLLPTRGVSWNTEFSSLFALNSNSHQITKLTTDMAVYSSLSDPTRLVSVLRFGYAHIFNEHYEYFQALDLGENNYLRGFRKNRFTGKSVMYQSTELRFKLFESKSYIVPGDVGLLAFNDVGRVWVKDVTSHKWHDAYGGGFFYSPYNFAIVSATVAFSNEDNLFNFSIGTKFNITF